VCGKILGETIEIHIDGILYTSKLLSQPLPNIRGFVTIGDLGDVAFDVFSLQEGEGSACEDPHMIGFDGRKFDFMGIAGGVYSLYSDRDIQINAKLAPWEIYGEDATVMSVIGIETEHSKISIHRQFCSFLFLLICDKRAGEVILDDYFLKEGERLESGTDEIEFIGSKVTIYTSSVACVVWFREGEFGKYLDIEMKLQSNIYDPHGILGQSVSSIPFSGEQFYEGEEDDYLIREVNEEVFGSGFTFNRFGVISERREGLSIAGVSASASLLE